MQTGKSSDQRPSYRRMLGDVHWRPNRDTLVALISYVLAVAGLFTAFQVFTTGRVAANFITFGPITLAGLGVAFPVFYTVLVRHRSLTVPAAAIPAAAGWA